MAKPTVSKHHMLGLLKKLASDDGFRARFEKDPKSALTEAGIPAAIVSALPAEQLQPGKLADKRVFETEHQRVTNDLAEECMCMIVPSPGWHSRKP